MFSKFLKLATSVLLLLSLTCGLIACAATPSESSFKEAYDNKIDELIDDVDDYYKLADKYDTEDMSMNADLSFNLSNELLTLLRSSTSYNLDWINGATVSVSENFKNDFMSLAVGLSYGKTDIVSADMIIDLVKGKLFMSVPEISDKFVEQKIEDLGSLESVNTLSLSQILPDKDALINLIKKCHTIIMATVGEVEFVEKDLVVNGIVEPCVEYTASLSQKEVATAALALLEMIKADNDFKAIVMDFSEKISEIITSAGATETPEQIYNGIIEEITAEIDDLKEIVATLTDTTMLSWTSYITDELELIGTKMDLVDVNSSATATFYAATAQDGDKVGKSMYFSSGSTKLFEIKGELTDNGKKLSGTYEIKAEGKSMAFIDLSDVDVKKLEDKYFVGSVSISPSKGLINTITGGMNSDFSMAGLSFASISLKFDVEKNNGDELKATVSVMSGSTPYAAITIDAEISDGKTVSAPSNTTANIESWLAGADFEELIGNVSESGLPDYITELLEMLTAEIS